MNEVKLYRNTGPYPYYNDTITTIKTVTATPLNQNLRSGYVDLQLTLSEADNVNYLSYARDGRIFYAWITDIEKLGALLNYRVHFEVDAYRTYKSDIVLGGQWVERATNIEAYARDPFYSALDPGQDYVTLDYAFPDAAYRTLIVLVRDVDSSAVGSPLQPSPYTIYMKRYPVSDWTSVSVIVSLLNKLRDSAEVSNIAAIYSVPGQTYLSTDQEIHTIKLKKTTQEKLFNGLWDSTESLSGFAKFFGTDVPFLKKSVQIGFKPDDSYKRVYNNTRLLIPDAGVLEIPDYLIFEEYKRVTRYIDIYSGATNYMLEYSTDGVNWKPLDNMIRGGAVGNIPVLSSPADSYISQNQNSLITQVLGDTAVLAGAGASLLATGGGSLPVAGPIAASAAGSLLNTAGNIGDADRKPPSNPPAVLGAALEPHYPGQFWLIWSSQKFDNTVALREKMGVAVNAFVPVTIPSSGFIKTRGCAVKCTAAVPLWAVQEINSLFDNGIFFNN